MEVGPADTEAPANDFLGNSVTALSRARGDLPEPFLGLSMGELAEQLGGDKSSQSRLESGH
ncbi:MAG TPA: hypothetical protein VND64_20665 [Pirellulales bacterium]|nr:hypothetical protein [Pirellulales bacterium]